MYTKFGAEERLPSGMRDMGDVVQTFGPAPSHHEWQNGIRQAQSWVNWIDHSSYTKMTVTMMIQICIPFYHILSLLSSEDLPSNPPPPSFPVPPPLIYTIHFATPQITDMNHSISFKTYSPAHSQRKIRSPPLPPQPWSLAIAIGLIPTIWAVEVWGPNFVSLGTGTARLGNPWLMIRWGIVLTQFLLGIIVIQERRIPINQPVQWNDHYTTQYIHIYIYILYIYIYIHMNIYI